MNAGTNEMDPLRLDGNAAAGVLSEVFVLDITTAHAICAACGAREVVGSLVVYDQGMGTVMRCPECDAVMLRITRTPTQLYVDATGAKCIVIGVP